jgi:hypothetical protein
MALYNPITGTQAVQMPCRLTSRKKQKTTSSTVAQRMYTEDAMNAYWIYFLETQKSTVLLGLFDGNLF